jgi:hypothetical protein
MDFWLFLLPAGALMALIVAGLSRWASCAARRCVPPPETTPRRSARCRSTPRSCARSSATSPAAPSPRGGRAPAHRDRAPPARGRPRRARRDRPCPPADARAGSGADPGHGGGCRAGLLAGRRAGLSRPAARPAPCRGRRACAPPAPAGRTRGRMGGQPQRPPAAEPDAEFAALLDQLRAALESRPLDIEGTGFWRATRPISATSPPPPPPRPAWSN